MLLFMVIMMVSRVRVRVRQAMVFGLMIYCLACGKWAGFEFLAGLFLAELHVIKANRQNQAMKEWESADLLDDQQGSAKKSRGAWERIGKPLLHLFLILMGLFIGGWPNNNAEKTPGIRWFLEKTPSPFAEKGGLAPQKFWFGVSAAFIVWSIGEVGALKRLFEGPIAQYCGRISYAIYICHGPVLDIYQRRVLGRPFEPANGEPGKEGFKAAVVGWGVKNFFGIQTKTQITIGWFVGLLLLGPLVIWAADIFWRAVDNPVVKLGKKLEDAVLEEDDDRRSSRGPRAQGYAPAA